MVVDSRTLDRVRVLIKDVLGIEALSDTTDLMEPGVMDSLALATIIAEIEQEFQVELVLDDLNVDRFRSLHRIAQLLAEMAPPVT